MFSEIILATFLGLIEGLTEFIPVSSTGHLILVSMLLHYDSEAAKTFEVFIQLGAILAVVILYWKRFRDLLNFQPATTRTFSGWAGISRITVASTPALIFGALFHHTIKEKLFSPLPVACALIVGGIAMLVIERIKLKQTAQTLEELSYRQCLFVGLFQVLSLWPGTSRSASTIIGGMLSGMSRSLAAEFSFIISAPIMFAAVGFDLWKSRQYLSLAELPAFSVGFLVSMLTAILAIRFFLSLLNRVTLVPFGIYRIVLGLVVLAFLFS